ncbi:MAG TPA: hypothetical protein DDX93_04635 [Smithella sp.]|jgi:nitronate monooxygenase|nr:hypothetical protein [Smithella sp.]
MFGIKYPIICGAMMWLCKPKLCAAISNAGGMGNLTAGNYSTENEFRDAIVLTRKLTDKPFMVNVTILPSVHITPEHHKMFLRVCVEEKGGGLEKLIPLIAGGKIKAAWESGNVDTAPMMMGQSVRFKGYSHV